MFKKNMAPLDKKLKSGGSDENGETNGNGKEQESCTGTRWLTSKEAIRVLKIPSCELMHRRERGELSFKKNGNSFYYKIEITDIS